MIDTLEMPSRQNESTTLIVQRGGLLRRYDAISEKYIMGISMDGALRLYGLNESQTDIKTDWDSDEIYFMYLCGSDG
ncbi:hypothetical protein BSKO_04331 [Bryopsis sp. KO-2023]|nr:hypothetical protein BSKO_04331 [Bryopsis sp. KO-2023]